MDNICPYHYSLYIYQQADILLAPFDYILIKNIRDRLGIELTGNIIIFDEAHNVETKSE